MPKRDGCSNCCGPTTSRLCNVSSASGSGIKSAAISVAGPGRWNPDAIANLDELAAVSQLRGIKIVAVVTGAPQWASGSADPYVPPRDPADFGRFLNALAARERGHVTAWEIWNEPDEKEFWHGAVGPAAYAPLLKAGSEAVREADPGALVLAGASTGNDHPFVEGLYAAGAGDAVPSRNQRGCGDWCLCRDLANGQCSGSDTKARDCAAPRKMVHRHIHSFN